MSEQPVLQKAVEGLIDSIEWAVKIFREKKRVSIFALLAIMILAEAKNCFLKPCVVNIADFIGISVATSHLHYSTLLYIVAGLLVFGIALSIFMKAHVKDAPASGIAIKVDGPIKGLRSFEREDHELFLRLERHDVIAECCSAILPDDFRFGILIGESGCGKSSLLKAGLLPEIEKRNHRVVYVKFSDSPPLQSIRSAMKKQLALPDDQKQRLADANIGSLFDIATDSNSKVCLFIFDQFEQFFTQNKLEEQRKLFINDVAAWYKNPDSSVKVLVGVREDFRGRMLEFQKAMGCSLLLQHEFYLKKFTKRQSVNIFKVIAAEEGLAYDESFIGVLCEQELCSEDDGLISGVDIQILAMMVKSRKAAGEETFSKTAFFSSGGIEGLLYHYLEKVLARLQEKREAAVKVLVSLIDLDRNVRKGVLTKEQIAAASALAPYTPVLQAIFDYLSSSEVRLLTPVDNDGIVSYELSHEKLIAPIRRISSEELKSAEKANLLLNKRVAYWLDNNKSGQYLLHLSELLLLRRERTYIEWGDKKAHKVTLIEQSRRRLYRTVWVGVAVAAAIGVGVAAAPTLQRQIQKRQFKAGSDRNMAIIKAAGKSFRMGSNDSSEVFGIVTDETPHEVLFTYDFKIGKYEVMQGEYREVYRLIYGTMRGENPSYFKGSDSLPIETVNWYDAALYCNGRSKIEGNDTVYCYKTSGKIKIGGNKLTDVKIRDGIRGYRLPTEAEWEFACRAGSNAIYYWGNDTGMIGKNCWYIGNAVGMTHKIGLKKPNKFGLFDMSGNVFEWCSDWYGAENYIECNRRGIVENPKGPETGSYRVFRGGSWYFNSRYCRCADRFSYGPGSRYGYVGFRVVFVP